MNFVAVLLMLLNLAPRVFVQAPTFISGTVTDDNKNPVVGALLSAGMFNGAVDANGRFTIAAGPGTTTLKVAAPGFETLTREVTVPSNGPLFGLEVQLSRAGSPLTGAGVFSGDAVRAIVRRAAAEWGPSHENVVRAMESQVGAGWPGTLERPIPVAATDAIDISLATPYVFYKTAIAEAVRKMESTVDVPYPTSVAILVRPKQIGAPDIEKIVVERDGTVLDQLGNSLERTVLRSRLGVEAAVHAGFVQYAPSAFAAGGTVRITAIPRVGANFVVILDEKTLLTIR